MCIGEKIKQLRTEHGISQHTLANLIGVSYLCLWNWEHGRTEPNLFNAILLADTFNVSLDELTCRDFKGEF